MLDGIDEFDMDDAFEWDDDEFAMLALEERWSPLVFTVPSPGAEATIAHFAERVGIE